MASTVSSAYLAEDSNMASAVSSSPVKKSWIEIRLVILIYFLFFRCAFRFSNLTAVCCWRKTDWKLEMYFSVVYYFYAVRLYFS